MAYFLYHVCVKPFMSQNTLSCRDTVVVPQTNITCWMNALIMNVFYSEAMRDTVIAHRRHWGSGMPDNRYTRELISIFDQIVRLYKRPGGDDNGFYDTETPEKILYLLNASNPTMFEYAGIRINSKGEYVMRDGWHGYKTDMYARKLLTFLGIPSITLDANKLKTGGLRLSLGNVHSRTSVSTGRDSKRVYSYRVKPKEEVGRIVQSAPPVIIVDIGRTNDWKKKTKVKKPSYYYFGGLYRNIPHAIKFGRHRYILDTVALSNTNAGKQVMTKDGVKKIGGHAISGLTCNGQRFIYSGWISKTKDTAIGSNTGGDRKSPCPLMPFDWTTDQRDFYITSKICQVQFTPPKPDSVKFNSVVGNRSHYYVRADLVKYKTKIFRRLGTVSGVNKLRVGAQLARQTLINARTTSVRLNQPTIKQIKSREKMKSRMKMKRRRF